MANVDNKVISLATIAMALGAAAQTIVGFQQFTQNSEKTWLGFAGVFVMAVLTLLTFGVAWKSYEIYSDKKK